MPRRQPKAEPVIDLLQAAKNLLNCIDNITTEEFGRAAERDDREALRMAIAQAEFPIGSKIRPVTRELPIYEVVGHRNFQNTIYVRAFYQNTPDQRVGLDLPTYDLMAA